MKDARGVSNEVVGCCPRYWRKGLSTFSTDVADQRGCCSNRVRNKRYEDTNANYRPTPAVLSDNASSRHQLVSEQQSIAGAARLHATNIDLYSTGSKWLE